MIKEGLRKEILTILDSHKIRKKQKLRNSEYYNMTNILDNLYAKSTDGEVFTKLMPLILSKQNIMLAYRNIKKNPGSKTPGVDKRNIEDVAKLSTESIINIVRKKLTNYNPKPVKRVDIPKPNGKTRPLGIPCIMDRVVQQCILQILEPICEAKFHERSNGFRPNRSAEHAISQCYRMIQCYNLHYAVDIDIEGFFDNVNHKKLRRQLWTLGIQDKKLLCIITKMLKAPIIMANKSIVFPSKGTPQGGILSPLLSNIVLNELDWWITNQWENMKSQTNYSCNSSKFRALRRTKLKEIYIVRYADDFKIFCRNYNDARRIFIATEKWLIKRLSLKISKEKSKIVNLKTKYSEFLGFKIKAIKRRNKYIVKSHISDKAAKNIADTLRNKIKDMQRCKNNIQSRNNINLYNSYVWGVHNYYQYATLISNDFGKIQFQIKKILENRLKKRLQKKGSIKTGYLKEKYGHSAQIRFVDGYPLTPIGYIRNAIPKYKKKIINDYTPMGRKEIHNSLKVDISIIHQLIVEETTNENVELSDNIISLYCAQCGKCAITGDVLIPGEFICHHKLPKELGGDDTYKNLILVKNDVHSLIHAIEDKTINEYMDLLNITKPMINKINILRKKAKLETISIL